MKILIVIIMCSLLVSFASVAERLKRSYAIRPKVYEQMVVVQQAITDKDWTLVSKLITELKSASLSEYELAQVNDLQGLTYYQLNQLEDALITYKAILESAKFIPEGMLERTLLTLAQLSMMLENYPSALQYAHQLLSRQPDNIDLYMLIASANYRSDQFTDALTAIKQARAYIAAEQQVPKENWLLLENAVYRGLSDYDGMQTTLKTLLALYPKSDYLLYLSSVYGELNESTKQLSLLESLYETNALSNPAHIVNLASLYMLEGAPYKCASLLDSQFAQGLLERDKRTLGLVSTCWQNAGEIDQTIASIQALADYTQEGKSYLRLAYTLFDNAKWPEAEVAANQALDKEDLDNPGEAWLLLGMVQLSQKKFDDSQRSFVNASRSEKTKKLAKQWLKYAENEQLKFAQLTQQEAAQFGVK